MAASATVEATAAEAATMKASAEARLAACGKATRHSAAIEAAESAGMCAPESSSSPTTESTATMKSATVKSTAVIESAVGENSAVGDVAAVVEHNSVTPVVTPMSPTPAKATEEADSKAKAKLNSRNPKVKSGIGIPAGPDSDGPSVNQPGIVFRNVDNIRIGRLDHDSFSFIADFFLVCTF